MQFDKDLSLSSDDAESEQTGEEEGEGEEEEGASSDGGASSDSEVPLTANHKRKSIIIYVLPKTRQLDNLLFDQSYIVVIIASGQANHYTTVPPTTVITQVSIVLKLSAASWRYQTSEMHKLAITS